MSGYADLLPVASEAVELASTLARSRRPGTLTHKGERDMTSEVDFLIERQVRELLRERTPEIGFIGEEEGAHDGTGELVWALDPVDGTANFIHGSPLCGVSLGLLAADRPVLGVIDLPFLGERYTAVAGGGAHDSAGPIRVSTTTRLDEAIVAVGDFAVGEDAAERNAVRLALVARLAERVQRVRMHGSAALDLAWLAAGRIDAMITLSNKVWDMAAGVIIAREAGAVVLDQHGTPHTPSSTATIATTHPLAGELLDLI